MRKRILLFVAIVCCLIIYSKSNTSNNSADKYEIYYESMNTCSKNFTVEDTWEFREKLKKCSDAIRVVHNIYDNSFIDTYYSSKVKK